MTKLATALVLVAAGLTAIGGSESPELSSSATSTPDAPRPSLFRVSRSMRRLPLPGMTTRHTSGKARRPAHQHGTSPCACRSSHDLHALAAAHNWDAVALCESSGNWAANTGNG